MMIEEILAEVWHHMSGEPMTFALEVVQFVLLAALVYGVAWGFGKRRGMLRNMLSESHAATRERVDTAMAMPDRLADARDMATARKRTARSQARKLIADARLEAERLQAEGEMQADAEAERLLRHTEEAIENEREETQAEVRERLIDVVARSTRAIMNERLSLGEQRKLIESAVMASVGSADSSVHDEGRLLDASEPMGSA